MKKKIFGGIAVLAIAAVAAWNVNLSSNEKQLSLRVLANVEALAGENDETDGSIWNGYQNNEQSCIISETVPCTIKIYIPMYGYCEIGFSYTLKHEGSKNPCTYTGNNNNKCDYYRCRKNA